MVFTRCCTWPLPLFPIQVLTPSWAQQCSGQRQVPSPIFRPVVTHFQELHLKKAQPNQTPREMEKVPP